MKIGLSKSVSRSLVVDWQNLADAFGDLFCRASIVSLATSIRIRGHAQDNSPSKYGMT